MDNLSLFICLNKPGATKEEEHPWFKDRIGATLHHPSITAKWISEHEVKIAPFPFKCDFKVGLKTKHVSKERRAKYGIERAYLDTDYTMQEVTLVG